MSHGRTTTTVTLRIPDYILEYIKKRCEKLQQSRNEYMNKVIANATIRKR